MKKIFIIFLSFLHFISFSQTSIEQYRPVFHFSPQKNWMNDPNGLVFFNGKYHLFYQYNPYGIQWGNMSWGHAVSTDLLNWVELPIAIPVINNVMAFSGSVVVDWNNTSGFGINGEPPLVAIYTGASSVQDQRLAYSNDEGLTWTPFSGNPVLNLGSNDFRDPKVIWYEESQQWIMVVSRGNNKKIDFYSSPNLKKWTFLQSFGPAGNTAGAWECPDLISLPLDGNTNNLKWMLVHSVAPGSAQYFIGDFNGKAFTWENPNPIGILIDDFENGTYKNWTVYGTAFGSSPATGTLPGQQEVSGYMGSYLVNSYLNGDGSSGALISNDFVIQKDYINFLIGGGNHPEKTCIKLVINNQVIHTSTGLNDEFLKWDHWDVTDHKGQTAHIEIIDIETGGWGHINIDHIIQTDEPVYAVNTGQIDYGKDFYALQSYSGIPESDGRRIWLAWMNNWIYADKVPTSPWKGIMSIPREIYLKTINNQYQLIQKPVAELNAQWTDSISFNNILLVDLNSMLNEYDFNIFEIVATVSITGNEGFSIQLRKGVNEYTEITFDFLLNQIKLDRSHSGKLTGNQIFSDMQTSPFNVANDTFDFRLVVDNCSVELFFDNGQVVFSNQIFPGSSSCKIDFTPINKDFNLEKIKISKIEIEPFGISEIRNQKNLQIFKMFPNPISTNGFTILLNDEKFLGSHFRIVTSSGVLVSQFSIEKMQKRISSSQFIEAGVYFIYSEYQGISQVEKIVVTPH